MYLYDKYLCINVYVCVCVYTLYGQKYSLIYTLLAI